MVDALFGGAPSPPSIPQAKPAEPLVDPEVLAKQRRALERNRRGKRSDFRIDPTVGVATGAPQISAGIQI